MSRKVRKAAKEDVKSILCVRWARRDGSRPSLHADRPVEFHVVNISVAKKMMAVTFFTQHGNNVVQYNSSNVFGMSGYELQVIEPRETSDT